MGIKKIIALLLVVIATIAIVSTPVNQNIAQKVAGNWISTNHKLQSKTLTCDTITSFSDNNGRQLAWIANLSPTGYIVIAADDQISPIISFSTENVFSGNADKNSLLAGFIRKDLSTRLEYVNKLSADEKNIIANQWKSYSYNGTTATVNVAKTAAGNIALLPPPVAVVPTVDQLLTTTWNQEPSLKNDPPSYNKLTPHNYPAGCGPVAMSQILKYYKSPDSASGTNTITTDGDIGEVQQLSFNDTFNYDLMPDVLTNTSTPAEVDEVAKLILDTGIAMKAAYTSSGTSASDLVMAASFKSKFKYKSADVIDTQAGPWEPQVQAELNSKNVVIFTLFSTVDSYAHFVVCDGYGVDGTTQANLYHLNMGWGGLDNNWYQMPTVTTTQFAFDQMPSIILNIRPGDPVVIPAAPTLLAPVTGSTVTAPVSITWDILPNTAWFEYVISPNADLSSPVETSANYPTFNVNIAAPLNIGTKYYWHVRGYAVNSVPGPWSPTWDFTVSGTPVLQTPVLSLPVDNATVTAPVTFTWQSVPTATTYTYQLSAVADMSTLLVNQANVVATTITPAVALTAGNTYYWRVQAADNLGKKSPFSTIRQFTVQLPTVPAPILAAPVDASTIPAPITLSWQPVANAVRYTYALSTTTDVSNPIATASTATTSILISTQMVPGTTYYWHVTAIDANNTVSPWSSIWSYTVQNGAQQLVAPVPTTPADNATVSGAISLGWQAIVNNASGYTYEIANDAAFATPFETISINKNTTLTALIQTALTQGVTYYWHIRSDGPGGTFSPWSTTMQFTVQAAPVLTVPAQLSPGNNVTNVTIPVTLAWSPVANASNYEYELYSAASATVPIETLTVATTSSIIQFALQPGTRYTWRVRAIDAVGTQSAFSPLWAFTTQAQTVIGTPVLTYPLNNAIDIITSPILTWQSAANATLYNVEVATDAGFANIISNNPGVTVTSYQVNNLVNNTIYYWRVTGGDATPRWGTPATASFTTVAIVPQKPASPVLTSPANGAVGIALNTALIWQAITNAVSYTLEYATNNNFINPTVVTGTNLSASVTLNSNTRYYWRVLATDGNGIDSDWSQAYFTTISQKVQLTAPTLTAPANNAINIPISANFTWSTISNALAYDIDISTNSNFTTKASYSTVLTSLSAVLAENTTYFWRVRAKQGSTLGPWSTTSSFTTAQFVATPGLDAVISN
ncbi:MAG: C10 family peptidase, partial [bacterium]